MFYEPKDGHGLPRDPFKAIVTPRPIGWISTRGADGSVNLAPYSFFNAICGRPPMVMFSSEGEKDSVTFARETRQFICNFASEGQFEAMTGSSAPEPRGVSEFGTTGLASIEGTTVDVPRVKDAPAALECRVVDIIRLKDLDGAETSAWMVIGVVTGVHIDEAFLTDGFFDLTKAHPAARLGYLDYSIVRDLFQAERPAASKGK